MRAGCLQIPTATDPATLADLYRQHHAPLVVLDDAVLVCACGSREWGGCTEQHDVGGGVEARDLGGAIEARDLGGAMEARGLGGAMEARDTGGATEGRDLGGAMEARDLGGAMEARDLGSAMEARDLGGAMEARDLGGAAQIFSCEEAPGCPGFLVSGAGTLRVFDGREVVEVRDRCVRD